MNKCENINGITIYLKSFKSICVPSTLVYLRGLVLVLKGSKPRFIIYCQPKKKKTTNVLVWIIYLFIKNKGNRSIVYTFGFFFFCGGGGGGGDYNLSLNLYI